MAAACAGSSTHGMDRVLIRPATRGDLARITEIYNHYVVHTPVTFDVEPYTVERRAPWFEQFALTGRYRLLVAEEITQSVAENARKDAAKNSAEDSAKNAAGEKSNLIGYAGTTRFRPKAAYETTVETTIYCAPESTGKGIGRRLYAELFAALAAEDINRIVAGYTLPNPASAVLHSRFGFKPIGIFSEVGRKFGRYWDVAWNERPLR